MAAPAFAAGETPVPPQLKWSFQGPFGKFDRAQLQRGFKVYREVCASCHGLSYVAFRNLHQPGGPEFSEAQVRALAAEYKIQDGPNDAGDMFERAGRPADHFPSPFPNENAAAAANGGKAPPDLSLMAKARTYERGFPWFIIDVFRQYSENGAGLHHRAPPRLRGAPAGLHGARPAATTTTIIPATSSRCRSRSATARSSIRRTRTASRQVPETVEQYATDVTAFLIWAAEPHLEARKRLGFQVMLFLFVLAGLLYFTKKKVWARVGGEVDGHAAP